MKILLSLRALLLLLATAGGLTFSGCLPAPLANGVCDTGRCVMSLVEEAGDSLHPGRMLDRLRDRAPRYEE